MNLKTITYILSILLIGSLIFSIYMYDQARMHETKYEEAIIDAEKAAQRIEQMKEDLEKALKESEMHRKQAEEALNELQKHKK